MTLPSQFSLEEENFYKDIQDLVKKGSQNEKELSSFLERYMDLLAKADLDEETFFINFTKAGLIIEASAKVYGTKVDKLWINLEHVLESLKTKSQGCKKKADCDDYGGEELDMEGGDDGQEEGKRKMPNSGRRKKKLGDALLSSDDFLEIDTVTGLLGKNMNENEKNNEYKLKLCEKVPNMFIKNKTKKKKLDVCLNKCLDDKDVIRLRDWIISSEGLLVKEIYTSLPVNNVSIPKIIEPDDLKDVSFCDPEPFNSIENVLENSQETTNKEKDFKHEKSNADVGLNVEGKELEPKDNLLSPKPKDDFIENLNISRESDLAKFPNVMNRLSGECLVDVDEVFWNSAKFQDVIPSKKMRAGKTNKLPCQLCTDKKNHKKKGRRCMEEKRLGCLDSYFNPHVQPSVSDPHFGNLPDEELYNAFKLEMKVIEHLGKVNTGKNIHKAYHPGENSEDLQNFLGFDGFDNYLLKGTRDMQYSEEEDLPEENLLLDPMEDDNDNFVEDPLPEKEFELPFPVTENSIKTNFLPNDDLEGKSNELIENPELEYQKLVIEELKDHYAARSSFAKNKELGIKISKWHEMIADKIKLSHKRGALNMNVLAEKIMKNFPNAEKPVMPFRDLVKKQSRRDVPRYFFACLQLTNEGNLDISKSNSKSLATDCMVITRLRKTRTNCELKESQQSPSKQLNNSKNIYSENKRKRDSICKSPSIEREIVRKKKKKEIKRTIKRPKTFNATNDTKRQRCSVLSDDSIFSE